MPARRAAAYTDPLEGIERLLVDGTNLLHALRRGAPAAPAATLVGRLRGVIEMPVRIELLFDGAPDQGLRDARIAAGLVVRYSGRMSADALLTRMVGEAVDPGTLLVVTDDVDLRHEITRRGGRTVGALWLIGRLERSRLLSPAIGRPKPPPGAGATAGGDHAGTNRGEAGGDGDGAPGWKPGRGATTKHGNPRKAPKSPRR
jgi:hypothetical protein